MGLIYTAAVRACRPAVAVAALMGSGCDFKKEPPPPPPPPEVEVMQVAQRDVEIPQEWVGTIDGLVNAQVRSRVQGYLIEQKYTEGAEVKKGDPLFEVDPRPFEAALSQAKADLARAQAEQARTDLDLARLEPLAPSGAVSQQEVDNARQLNEANKAVIKAMEANVEQAELSLSYTKVLSPIDGVAGISQSQIGDLVGGPGSPILTTISTIDPIRVYVPISEQEYLRFTREIQARTDGGQRESRPIDLILSDGSVFPHKGKLDVLNRQVDPTTGTIQITILYPNAEKLLRPGLYAKVRAVVSTLKGALLVPQRAVVDMQGVYLVGVVEGGKATLRPVKVGERMGSDWIITDGLKAGETIVVEGVQKIRDGQPVTTKPYTPPAAPTPAGARANEKN